MIEVDLRQHVAHQYGIMVDKLAQRLLTCIVTQIVIRLEQMS